MYLAYVSIPQLDGTHALAGRIVAIMQPLLIFSMLFVTFCKVRFKELRFSRWHLPLLGFQLFTFIGLSLAVAFIRPMSPETKVLLESAMMCLICPTATAAAVITARLGGNSATLISYTILINICVATVAPFFLTLSHPIAGMSPMSSFLIITSKVFPLLLCPLIAAESLRFIAPGIHNRIATKWRNMPFYLWLVSLSLAIAMTTRAIAHTRLPMYVMAGIAFVSFICCATQFALGRWLGSKEGETITAGQALGQKNTVFAIWFAYTFLTPVTAIAGGFYSIWHNTINTWQLYRHNHSKK